MNETAERVINTSIKYGAVFAEVGCLIEGLQDVDPL